jgi:hypothetical protein
VFASRDKGIAVLNTGLRETIPVVVALPCPMAPAPLTHVTDRARYRGPPSVPRRYSTSGLFGWLAEAATDALSPMSWGCQSAFWRVSFRED